VILSLGLSGLGILIASFMTSQQGFQLVIQLLIFPLIFLAGVFYPVDNVPDWLAVISKPNPLTYGVDAIRQIFLGQLPGIGVTIGDHTVTLLEEIAIIGALGTLLLGAAVVAFNRRD
jgi:ABC-2 type transport system permease protein